MKNIILKYIGFLALTFLGVRANCQDYKTSVIPSLQLEITDHKTTNLIFPYSIKNVDKGSQDILAQKVIGAENILQLKAAKSNFKQTNLTVIAGDGVLYPFTVSYVDEPIKLNIIVHSNTKNEIVKFEDDNYNEAHISKNMALIQPELRNQFGIRTYKENITLSIPSLYFHDNYFYFLIELENYSKIPYVFESIEMYVIDKKKAKQTANQELRIEPILEKEVANSNSFEGKQSRILVIPKFPITKDQYVKVVTREKNGGRQMELKVKPNKIFTASRIQN